MGRMKKLDDLTYSDVDIIERSLRIFIIKVEEHLEYLKTVKEDHIKNGTLDLYNDMLENDMDLIKDAKEILDE